RAQCFLVVPVLRAKVDHGAYAMRRCQVGCILAGKRAADREPLGQPVEVRLAPRRYIFLHFFIIFFFSYSHEAPGGYDYCCFDGGYCCFHGQWREQQSFTTVPRPYVLSLQARTDPRMKIVEPRLRADRFGLAMKEHTGAEQL